MSPARALPVAAALLLASRLAQGQSAIGVDVTAAYTSSSLVLGAEVPARWYPEPSMSLDLSIGYGRSSTESFGSGNSYKTTNTSFPIFFGASHVGSAPDRPRFSLGAGGLMSPHLIEEAYRPRGQTQSRLSHSAHVDWGAYLRVGFQTPLWRRTLLDLGVRLVLPFSSARYHEGSVAGGVQVAVGVAGAL